MRSRTWAAVPLILLIVVVAAAACVPGSRAPQGTPIPTKTLRPTFTYTPVKQGGAIATSALLPTATRQPAAATAPAPTAVQPTVAPPTVTPPTATPEKATLTTTDSARVRGGPGTNYPIIGEVRQGQTFDVTGKNPAGDWWQIIFEGQPAWLIGQYARPNAAAGKVPVAANIPAPPPTARPQPTSPPAPPQPTQPPAPVFSFTSAGFAPRPNTNDIVTIWCQVKTRDGAGLVAGTIRVMLGGNAVKPDQPFTNVKSQGDTGYSSQFDYNQNCKVEVQPAMSGTYTAFLVEGGKQISEAINFTVSGDTRTFILTWVQK